MINLYAPINNLGYGIFSLGILKALIRAGEQVCLFPIGQIQSDSYYDDIIKASIKNCETSYDAYNPGVQLFHDTFSNQFTGKPKLCFSMFETDRLGTLSKRMLGHSDINCILTPTEDHKRCLELDLKGHHGNFEILHGGVDPDVFNITQDYKFIDTKKFTFITAGKNEKRKNTEKIIKAFINTCQYKECALICHTYNPFINGQEIEKFTSIDPSKYGFTYKGLVDNKAHVCTNGICDIYFTVPKLSASQMKALYKSANVGIQCSSGEGWDLPLCEMMACGLNTITTTGMGHNEFMLHDELSIEPIHQEMAQDDMFFKGTDQGLWNVIDQKSIEDKIELVINDQNKYTHHDKSVSDHILTKFSWDVSAKNLVNIISKYKD